MLNSFRNYIRRSNPTGRAALWLVYGILVVATWLVSQCLVLGRTLAIALYRWIFTGSVLAVSVKVAAIMIIIGVMSARAGMEMFAANLITLTYIPVVVAGFAIIARKYL